MNKKKGIMRNYLNMPLFKNGNFIKQMIATAVSRFGDGIDTIAFSWLSYKITGSALIVATLFALNGLPNIIFGVLSGVVSKYYSKKRIIIFCDLGRGICVLMVAMLSITGNLKIWHLYAITFFNSSFESFRAPASTAMVPEIIESEYLEQGIAANTSSSKVTELIGLAIAPVVIGLLNAEAAIIIDSITFFICAILMLDLKLNEKIDHSRLTVKKYGQDLKDGFKYIIKDKLVLHICIFSTLINALIVPYDVLQAPFVETVLNRGPEAMTFMSIPLILAITIGVTLAPKIKSKIGGRNMIIWGGILLGINYCLLVFNKFDNTNINNLLLIIESFSIGMGIICINFSIQVAMYKKVDTEYLSRVAAIFNATVLSAIPFTSCIVGLMSQFIGIGKIFILFGVLTIIIFVMQYLNKVLCELNNI